MTDVKSKNLYELLGNDHDQDSDKEPEPPVKTVDKPVPGRGKRDAPKEAPTAAGAGAAPRRDAGDRTGGFNQENRQFRDRTNGRNNPNPTENRNRDRPAENTDGTVRGRDSGPGTQRGGRGQRGPRRGGDRHVNRTGRSDNPKQADQGWGAQTGEGEETIEKAGEADAQEDKKEEVTENATVPDEPIPEPEPEPEDNSVSYAEYLEQQATKKLGDLGIKEARAPNEGAKDEKKWKNATALSKEEGADFFVGEQKAKRERERAQKKQVLEIDYAFKEPSSAPRGGSERGRGRGGRGRGEGRGEFRGDFRGRGRGRGDREDRGDRADRAERPERTDRDDNHRPRGDRGAFRGGRGRSTDQPAIADDSAFPALGGK